MPAQMPTNDQSQQRRYKVVHDQHGRRWGGSFELKSGDFTGKIEYLEHMWSERIKDPSGVHPPWLPDQNYIRPVPDEANRVHIDYAGLERQFRHEMTEYQKQAMRVGLKKHGDMYNPDAPITRDVLSIIGNPPIAVDVVIAARQGNPWLLGKTDRVDHRLVKFLVSTAKPAEPDYSEPDYGDEADSFACPECDFVGVSSQSLNGHIGSAHRRQRVGA